MFWTAPKWSLFKQETLQISVSCRGWVLTPVRNEQCSFTVIGNVFYVLVTSMSDDAYVILYGNGLYGGFPSLCNTHSTLQYKTHSHITLSYSASICSTCSITHCQHSCLGFSHLPKDTSACGTDPGIDPPTFCLVDGPLYLLSHSHVNVCHSDLTCEVHNQVKSNKKRQMYKGRHLEEQMTEKTLSWGSNCFFEGFMRQRVIMWLFSPCCMR